MRRLSRNRYSDSTEEDTREISSDFQPNSVETIWLSATRIPLHSRTALTPPSTLCRITPSVAYQMAARVFSSMLQ